MVRRPRWGEIRILRIFRFEIGTASIQHVTLQSRFTVDQRCHDIAVSGIFPILQDDNVPIENVRIDH